MRKRTRARELALQVLYQVDIRREDPEALFEDFWQQESASKGELNDSIKEFATTLVRGTLKNLERIDRAISSYAENWHLERMAIVDRNIMRMATHELLYMDDIPPKVSINEAVDLAKKYGDLESGKFVNGILDKISKKERKKVEGKKADLHVHTTYSDGSFSPEEVVQHAKEKGLDCIAITDHDSVNGIEEAKRIGDRLGVEIVPAVEVSAEEDSKEIHILGYYVDYKDKELLDILKQIREDRKKRLYKIVDALNQHGLNIDCGDLIEFAGDVSISRLHIAHYMKAKGLVSSWREAFSKYIGDTKPCYVAGFRYSPKQTIGLIKRVKGVPVIAHPGLNKLEAFLPKLVKDGIEGIEVFYGEHSGCMIQHYKGYAEKHNLLITGGSDCHGTAKGDILMGKVTIPYSYVEALKKHRQ